VDYQAQSPCIRRVVVDDPCVFTNLDEAESFWLSHNRHWPPDTLQVTI
jgi:hypothetical protein